MPIYEYRCNACGHKLESLQRLSDAPLVACPACGKDALAKQLSAAGFQLKGSGWYATDFKNSGSKPKALEVAKPDAKADAPAGAASEVKSDTSTAAKADAPATSSGTSSATKTADQGKSESRSTSDKPASTGTTSGGS
jgi:putative FmdB family regulatory protein